MSTNKKNDKDNKEIDNNFVLVIIALLIVSIWTALVTLGTMFSFGWIEIIK